MGENQKIPSRIFYVWGANESKPTSVNLCILSWQQIMPDYKIIEINENSTKYFNFQKELKDNKWFRTVYERKLYAYVADYIRIKTLYEHGGIYLDTDVSAIKTFDKYLNEPAFVGVQNDSKSAQDSNLEPAILGAQKNNSLLKEILNFYNQGIWRTDIYTMPHIFDYFITKMYGKQYYPPRKKQKIIKLKDITIYPQKYFTPMNYDIIYYKDNYKPYKYIEPETVAIHWYNGSWVTPEVVYFLQNKHKYTLEELDRKTKKLYTKVTIEKKEPFKKSIKCNFFEYLLNKLHNLEKIKLLTKQIHILCQSYFM